MRKTILTILAAGVAAVMIADFPQAEARSASGSGIGRAGGGWGGSRWSGAPHRGSVGFHRGRFAPLAIGSEPGRYLSETASFLADNAGYLTGSEIYPDLMGGPFGDGYPADAVPTSFRPEPMATYVVPVHRSRNGARQVVRVFRGARAPTLRPPFAPDVIP